MQTGRLTESYMERDLQIGKEAYADRLAYLLSDKESCSAEMQRVCRYSVGKGAYADSEVDLLAGRESCSAKMERELHIL
jgi:hypothetical protein